MKRHQAHAFLCSCLTPLSLAPETTGAGANPPESWQDRLADESLWKTLIELAGLGLVTPSLAENLRRRGYFGLVPDHVQDYLIGIRDLNRKRNDILSEELHKIIARLNAFGVEPILLKGSIDLVINQYPGSIDRVIGDLDILVPEDRIDEIFEYMQFGEYEVSEEDNKPRAQWHHHAPPILHRSRPVCLELHHQLSSKQYRQALRVDRFRECSERVDWQGVILRVPDMTSRILHIFVHTALQDRSHQRWMLPLRPLTEFSNLAAQSNSGIDWNGINQRLTGNSAAAWRAWCHATEVLFNVRLSPGSRVGLVAQMWLWNAQHNMSSSFHNRLLYWFGRAQKLPRRLATPHWYGNKVRAMMRGEPF